VIVCLDTNVLLPARSKSHRWHCLLRAIALERVAWAISNRILTEYEEIVRARAGEAAWITLAAFMELVDVSGNMIRISPHFQFHVIGSDPDDNAFTDCAIAAHADYIITADRHFAPLARAGYKPQPITPDEFIQKHQDICA
jgi:uncharacterized protein